MEALTEIEVRGARVALFDRTDIAASSPWKSARTGARLMLNLGSEIEWIEGTATGAVVCHGAPSFGAVSYVPREGRFAGRYGEGRDTYLVIEAPTRWPAREWPAMRMRHAAPVIQAPAILRALAEGDHRTVERAARVLWNAVAGPAVAPRPRHGRPLDDAVFVAAQRIVAREVHDLKDMRALADRLGASLDGLDRTFRERLGRTVATHVADTRLGTAVAALAKASVAEAAYLAGYASQSHLTGVMTRRMGVTPRRFQLAVRQAQSDVDGLLKVHWDRSRPQAGHPLPQGSRKPAMTRA